MLYTVQKTVTIKMDGSSVSDVRWRRNQSLTWKGIECIDLLHQLVENIHSRRPRGDYSIPSIMVDHLTEGRINAVLAAQETPDDWWVLEGPSGTEPVWCGVPRLGAPYFPPAEGVHSCPSATDAYASSRALRSSRASRLARLAEASRLSES